MKLPFFFISMFLCVRIFGQVIEYNEFISYELSSYTEPSSYRNSEASLQVYCCGIPLSKETIEIDCYKDPCRYRVNFWLESAYEYEVIDNLLDVATGRCVNLGKQPDSKYYEAAQSIKQRLAEARETEEIVRREEEEKKQSELNWITEKRSFIDSARRVVVNGFKETLMDEKYQLKIEQNDDVMFSGVYYNDEGYILCLEKNDDNRQVYTLYDYSDKTFYRAHTVEKELTINNAPYKLGLWNRHLFTFSLSGIYSGKFEYREIANTIRTEQVFGVVLELGDSHWRKLFTDFDYSFSDITSCKCSDIDSELEHFWELRKVFISGTYSYKQECLDKIACIVESCTNLDSHRFSSRSIYILFSAILNSNTEVRGKYYDFLSMLFEKRQIYPRAMASFTDRYLLDQGLLQKFGTQIEYDIVHNKIKMLPVENPDSLNALRESIRLPPIDRYKEDLEGGAN